MFKYDFFWLHFFYRAEKLPEKVLRGKYMKKSYGKLLEIAILLAGTMSFWGFLYPEFSMAEDVCIKSKVLEYILNQSPSEETELDEKIQEIIEVAFHDKQKCTDWGV